QRFSSGSCLLTIFAYDASMFTIIFLVVQAVIRVNRVDAEVSAADFRVYATPKHFAGNDPDELVEAVSEVETSHNHRVVLYHVMSMHNYLLAWFANGLMRKQTVQFRVRWPLRGPSPISDELLTLSVFEEGNQFPSFDKLPATFCAMGRYDRPVRDADPQEAKILGDGMVRRQESQSSAETYTVVYTGNKTKTYNSCNDLVYAEFDDMNNQAIPALTDAELVKHGVKSASNLMKYLDGAVGTWRDAEWPPNKDPGLGPTLGVSERLLKAQINLFSKAVVEKWEQDDGATNLWESFMAGNVTSDTKGSLSDQVSGKFWGHERDPLYGKLMTWANLTDPVNVKVLALRSLLACVGQRAFLSEKRKEVMECWEHGELDKVASLETKDALFQLQRS
ncbi:unnamed protein product, partial [Symbiodinium pilosum]